MTLASSSTLTTVTVQAGSYAESVSISKSVKFFSTGATVNSFTLASGESIDPASTGVTATSITVSSTGKLQDAMYLASAASQTSVNLQGSSYAETVTIGTAVRFTGTTATASAIVLNSGASIATGGSLTTTNVTVNTSAKVADALALASPLAQTTVTIAAGVYNDDVTVARECAA